MIHILSASSQHCLIDYKQILEVASPLEQGGSVLTPAAGRQHGAVYSDTGYALALTPTHALIWPYTANAPSPETFTFALPYPSKSASDPLPIGSLVSSSASSQEPGLVVIMPTSGKIIYWESVASASTIDLIQQQRNGVQMAVPGMLSGETVVQVLNAESAGFILAFSSGRLAYMSVRDGQGRPAISIQFLRSSGANVGSGLFGSLRNALSSTSWKGDISAVKAGGTKRVGERDVVVATSKGRLQVWEVQRGGHNVLQAEVEGRESIVMALKQTSPELQDLVLENFELIDFAFSSTTTSDELAVPSDILSSGVDLLLLTSLTDRNSSHYALVEVTLATGALIIKAVQPITSYKTPLSRSSISRPRLYLPKPGLVAFVVFDRAVIIASVSRPAESPETQLMMDNQTMPKTFEDVVDFRSSPDLEIVGSGYEEPIGSYSMEDSRSRRCRAKYAAAIVLVKGGGVIRVAVKNVFDVGGKPPIVTAKSKLEQAVFFGTLDQNPLSFTGRPEISFTTEDISEAALELSNEILSSRTPHIATVFGSMEHNLKRRSAALHSLALHLQATNISLDRVTRWKLLWDAEKVAAATVVWQQYDSQLKEKPEGQKRGLLAELVDYMHEDFKTEPVEEVGEVDRVRHWFVHDLWRMGLAVAWAFQVVKEEFKDGKRSNAEVAIMVSEADDVVIGALTKAFEFRAANLVLYGLQTEQLDHGILKAGYAELPEFWTSLIFITENVRRQIDFGCTFAINYWQTEGSEGKADEDFVTKIGNENGKLVGLWCQTMMERARWCLAQADPKIQCQGTLIEEAYFSVRKLQIIRLSELGLTDQATTLAETYEVLETLAELVMGDLDQANAVARLPGVEEDAAREAMETVSQIEARMEGYFVRFGDQWAEALYSHAITQNKSGGLLDDHGKEQAYVTKFLRKSLSRAKVAWMNDVLYGGQFDLAAESLLETGINIEQDLWSRKVELSIGKLARLAGTEYGQANSLPTSDSGEMELKRTNQELQLVSIQEKLLAHIGPSIKAAIDESAALQLAMEVYDNKGLKGYKAFPSLLGENMGLLIRHEKLDALALIDLLTLMGRNDKPEEHGVIDGQEFYLALKALMLDGLMPKDELRLTAQTIWRRCLIRDDWPAINNTDLQDDSNVQHRLKSTALFSTLRECFKNRMYL